ncbi:glycosyltransferase family 4 protein [Candidatus Leptofilum sp.]|uniref:glycosyltransferase family 4 protein n=1 Tax=Candidatus Leptofilum sp. TaxID=3241576 RepID=UPI003B59F570
MTRFCLIGPTYPYRGGIAHYTTLLAQHMREAHEVMLLSFSRQYPAWLFPGKSDKDPSERPLQTEAHYVLDPLNPFTWRHTLRQIRDWQPDVVIIPWWHPYFAPVWTTLGRGIHRLAPRPKLIFICHNVRPHEQSRLGKWLLPHTLKTVLGRADGFIVHSRADKHILLDILPQARVSVSPLPTYAALGGEPATEIPVELPTDRPLLLFCGLVRPYKGLDVLLEAMALLKRPVHLLIAGEFWQGGQASYQVQIEQLELTNCVTIINEYLPDELLAACIDRANVVVLPYRSATQSAVVQMAFGRGKPVITTNVGGLAEAVEDGRTGLVVPPEDPPALAAAIERYFAEGLEDLFSENMLGGNGRFGWNTLLQNIQSLSANN